MTPGVALAIIAALLIAYIARLTADGLRDKRAKAAAAAREAGK
jgi:hypothetical protein